MSSPLDRLRLSRFLEHHWAAELLLLLLAFWLRISGITSRSLWYDEAVEFLTANVPMNQLIDSITLANLQPPLFTLLLSGWSRIEIDPIWLRLLPALISMFTLVGIMKLGRLALGQRGGWLAGLFGAVMPVEIYYAQDLGEYSLAVCTLTWSLFFLYLAQERGHWRYWLLWGFFAGLSISSHYGMGITIFAAAMVILMENVKGKDSSRIIRQGVVALTFVILVAPIIWRFLPQQLSHLQSWRNAVTSSASLIQEIGQIPSAAVDTFSFLFTGASISQIPTWVGSALLLVYGFLVGLFSRQIPGRLVWWFISTFVIYYVLVRTGLYSGTFGLRYSQIFTPILVTLMAGAALLLMRRVNKWLGLALVMLTIATFLWAYPHPSGLLAKWSRGSWSPIENMGLIYQDWWDSKKAEEVTYVYYGGGPSFQYYWKLNQAQGTAPCFQAFTDRTCAEIDLYIGSWFRQLPVDEKLARMEKEIGRWPEKLWLLFSHAHGQEEDEILDALSDMYEITISFQESGASAYLLERLAPQSPSEESVVVKELYRMGDQHSIKGILVERGSFSTAKA